MAKYTIAPGDSLSKIARRYGLTWQDLYNHDENDSFRDNHPDPDLIHPGETIWVPDPFVPEIDATPEKVCVTRSSNGENHLNTICTSYSVYLHILLSLAECLDVPDNFTLYTSADGGGTYRKTLSLRDKAVEINGNTYLIFDGIVSAQQYGLMVEAPNSKPETLFEAVPYAELPGLRRHAPYQSKDVAAAPAPPVRFSDYSFGPIFDPLGINVVGEGAYHVNRFRIYFRAVRWTLSAAPVPLERFPRRAVLPIARVTHPALVKEFIRDFPVLFNGGKEGVLSNGIRSVTWMDLKNRPYWKHNMALVVRHQFHNRKGDTSTVLGFEIDIQPLRVIILKLLRECVKAVIELPFLWTGPFGKTIVDPIVDREVDKALPIPMPQHPGSDPEGGLAGFRPELTNAHADWVGINMLDESRGFAVQTLWRHQRDWASQRLVDLIDNAYLPQAVKEAAHRQEEDKIELFNQFHFLAGRRSWVLCPATDPLEGDYISTPKNGVYFLETAAIERYSQAIHDELTSKDPGFAVEFREAVKTVWIRLLMNYVTASGFEVVPLDQKTGQWDVEAKVNFKELSFDKQSDAEAHSMTVEIIKMHPTLGEQLHN